MGGQCVSDLMFAFLLKKFCLPTYLHFTLLLFFYNSFFLVGYNCCLDKVLNKSGHYNKFTQYYFSLVRIDYLELVYVKLC